MPDTERIVLEVDEKGVATSVSSANREVAKLEASFARAGQTAEQRLLSKIANLQQRMANDPMRLKELDALQQKVLKRMGDNAEQTGEKFKHIGEKIKEGIENPLGAAGSAAQSLLMKLGPLGAGLGLVAVTFGAIVTAAFEAAKSLGHWGEEVNDVRLRTGLSSKEVGEFTFAAKAAGSEIGVFERIMKGMTAALEDDSDAAATARGWLVKFGVDIAGVRDGSVSTARVLEQVSVGLNALPTNWQRNRAAMDLFKRSGIEVAPVIIELAENLKHARENQFGFHDEDVAQAKHYQVQVTELETAWDKVWRKIKQAGAETGAFLAAPWYHATTGKPLEGTPWAPYSEEDEPKARSLTDERVARELITSDRELDARVKIHVQKQNEAMKQYREDKKKLDAFEKQMAEKEMSPAERIFSERAALPASVRGQTSNTYLVTAAAELRKQIVEKEKAVFDMDLKTRQKWVKESDAENKAMEESNGRLVKGWLYDVDKLRDKTRELDTQQISLLGLSATHRARMAESTAGPGQEVAAAREGLAIRVQQAQQEFAIKDAHSQMYDMDKVRFELQKEMQSASYEYEEKIADIQRTRFENLKDSMGGLLDAAFARSKSMLDALKSMAQALILSPVKEAASSAMARVVMPVLYGKDGGGGIMGRITGAFGGAGINNVRLVNGAVPVVITGTGGGSGGGMFTPAAAGLFGSAMAAGGGAITRGGEIIGGGGSTAGLTQMASGLWQRGPGAGVADVVGGPGGTSGFAGPVGYGGGIGGATQAAGGGKWGGLGNLLAGGKGMLTSLGNIGRHADFMGPIQHQSGVGGAAGGAMLAGGGILAMDGLRRGGWLGVGETTAGGALIGAKFGGPLGAAIGAGVGFIAGLVRLKIKSATEKVIEKVKSLYQITLDTKHAKLIVDIANQSYGKDLNMAVRSPEARELIKLYAQTMGQKVPASLVADQPHAAALLEASGQLQQGAIYENGQAYTYGSSLRTYGGVSSETLPTSGPNAGVTVMLNPAQTVDLWRTGTTQAMAGNPRLVSQSALRGSQSSSTRAGNTINSFAPSAISQ